MSNGKAGQRRRAMANQRMDQEVKEKKQTGNVLLKAHDLTDAVNQTTAGGKKPLEGLYMPDGRKVQTSAEHLRVQNVKNKDASEELALSKVAKTYEARQKKRLAAAEKTNKDVEEMEDEEAKKKAQVILDNSTEHEKIQYRELFNFFDVDKDRTWGSIEFAQRMTDIGCNTSVESASNLLYFAGVRDVDRITYEDFVQLMPKLKAFRKLLEKDAMQMFKARDNKGRGWITSKALREMLLELAGPDGMEEEQIERILREADRERTDMITFEFFIRALFGTPPLLVYKPPSRAGNLLSQLFLCGRSSATRDDSDDEDELRL